MYELQLSSRQWLIFSCKWTPRVQEGMYKSSQKRRKIEWLRNFLETVFCLRVFATIVWEPSVEIYFYCFMYVRLYIGEDSRVFQEGSRKFHQLGSEAMILPNFFRFFHVPEVFFIL
jgi:hypothetical protein